MIKAILSIGLCVVCCTSLRAQEATPGFKFDDLRTPASPGFILLDQAPSSVERPTTPQGFAINVIQGATQGGAFETAPFWLLDHENLTFEALAFKRFPVLETLSLSVSSNKSEEAVFVAAGARVQFIRLWSKAQQDAITRMKDSLSAMLNEDPDDLDIEGIGEQSQRLSQMLQKPTLVLEVAGAVAGSSEQGNFENLDRSRAGLWASVALNPFTKLSLSAVGLLRYIENPNFEAYTEDAELLDYGARVLYMKNRLGLSGEFVHRNELNGAEDSFHRLSGIIEYKLSDKLYATATYGKNFGELNNIIALVGVNIGFSATPNVDL